MRKPREEIESPLGVFFCASVPNITGQVTVAVTARGYTNNTTANGAFNYDAGATANFRHMNEGAENWGALVGFSAQRSNGIYGNSTTVQPPSMRVVYIIKY